MKEIAILVPTYKRAYKLEKVVKNIHDHTKVGHEIYFITEPDDTNSQVEIEKLGEKYIINQKPHNYVSAINLGFKLTLEPIVFMGSDDILFTSGWDTETIKDFKDPKIQMIGYPDEWPVSKTGLHGSHFAVKREYIEKQGGTIGEKNTVYFSGYEHQHCDIETEQTAQMRGVWKQSKAVIDHLHWSVGKSPRDATYERAVEANAPDWVTYNSRRYLFEQHIFKELFQGRIIKPFRGKLSIIIPSYNQKEYLQKTVESLKENTFNPYELIIVDDCSNKETVDYIESLDCVKVFNKTQKYVTANWNAGIKLATGDYIAILNNDVTLSDYWDCYLMEALKGDVWVANPYQKDAGASTPYGNSPRTGSIDVRGSCFMFKKSLIKKIGLLPEQLKIWYSDWYLGWLIVEKYKKQTVYIPQSVVFHYGSKSSWDFDSRTGKLKEIIAQDREWFEKFTKLDGDVEKRFKAVEKSSLIEVIPARTGSCGGYHFEIGEKIKLPETVVMAVGYSNFEVLNA